MPDWRHRLEQGVRALRSRPELDEALFTHRWLTDRQRAAFAALPAHDRGHLVRVARELTRLVPHDHDLIIAGLLHDLGKSNGVSRVRLADRTVKVILERLSPRLLGIMAQPYAAGLRAGLSLAVHHPEIGAERARELGCSDRVVWLIKHHEDAKIDDPGLRLLVEIDRMTP